MRRERAGEQPAPSSERRRAARVRAPVPSHACAVVSPAMQPCRFEIADVPARGRCERLRARARRQRRARAGARAPRPRRAGSGARVPRGRRGASAAARSPASSAAVAPILAHVARRRADHDPRRLRRRRHLLDGGAGARAARAGRRRRLLPARPRERRLRAERGHGRAARRARHAPAGDGRLRDHRRRGGRAGAGAGDGGGRHRPPRAARGRRAAGCADRASGAVRLPVRRISARRRSPTSSRRRCSRGAPARDAARAATRDLDLVALATIADVVPLRRREPHARARAGCARWRAPPSPGCAR